MRHLLSLLLSISISVGALAQEINLNGMIVDSASQTPVSFATIYLYRQDSTVVEKPNYVLFTGDDGRFTTRISETGGYLLKLNMVGYVSKTQQIQVHTGTNELDPIAMQPSAGQLKEVTITARKPLIEMKPDRLIYNVEDDPTNNGASTAEILRKVPFVSVDMNDDIRIKGQNNFLVQLNGRSTGIFARNPKEAIRSFPANLIVRIEVITSPGARYDAEGVGGIINIVTKKKVVGTKGALSADVNTLGGHNESFSISNKQGKLGLFLSMSNHGSNLQGTSEYTRMNRYPATLYSEVRSGESTDKNTTQHIMAEIAWDIDSLSTISLHGSLNSGNYNMQAISTHLGTDIVAHILESGYYKTNSVYKSNSENIGIDYIRKFKKQGRNFSISMISNQQTGDSKLETTRTFDIGPSDTRRIIRDIQPQKEKTVDMNFSESINDHHSLSFGTKAILRSFTNDYGSDSLNMISNIIETDQNQSGIFHYTQNVWASYAEHAYYSGKWGVQTGIRYEYTGSEGDLNGLQPFSKNYPSFFPSLNVGYVHNQKSSFQFGVIRGLSRPGLSVLNPQVDVSDPRRIFQGNPLLNPEYTTSLNLGWNCLSGKINYNFSLSQSWTTGVINQVFTIDDNEISNSTYQNTGKTQKSVFSMSISGRILPKTFMMINNTIAFEQLTGTQGTDVKLYNQGFTGTGFATVGQKLPKGWSVQAVGFYHLGYLFLQGQDQPTYSYQAALGKTLLKSKKLYLSLTANMPAQKYWKNQSLFDTPELYISDIRNRPARSFQITATWRFGKLKGDVSRKRDVQNTDLKEKVK